MKAAKTKAASSNKTISWIAENVKPVLRQISFAITDIILTGANFI